MSNISAARKDFQGAKLFSLRIFLFLAAFSNIHLFSAKLDGVKTYMRIRKVPGNIQIKVKIFNYNILINPIMATIDCDVHDIYVP